MHIRNTNSFLFLYRPTNQQASMMTMMHLFLLMLCVLSREAETAQSKDSAVVNLMVETTISAANRIDNSESIFLAS